MTAWTGLGKDNRPAKLVSDDQRKQYDNGCEYYQYGCRHDEIEKAFHVLWFSASGQYKLDRQALEVTI